jgi:thiol-disulfide isomerase/thioredoxin
MSTKKAVLVAVGILSAVALVVALFAGAIVGFVFYTIGNSGAAQTAKTFLRQNDKLRREIGEVRDFGYFTTGDIKTQGSMGTAELRMKVIGATKNVNTTVDLSLGRGEWRVVDAFYDDESGQRIFLTKAFDEPAAMKTDGADSADAAAAATGAAQFDEQSFSASVLESTRPVLVVVGTPSSLDSVDLDKSLARVAPRYRERVGLVRYNLSEQPVVLVRLGVKIVPTVILFKGGEERERRGGRLSERELAQLLDKYLE